jgi:hypothetical protein
VVLDDLTDGAGLLVEGSPLLDAEGLGHGDLHAVPVLQALEDGVAEAEDEEVLHRLLAEVVVDAKMRSSGKAWCNASSSSRAVTRSRPKGFSTTSEVPSTRSPCHPDDAAAGGQEALGAEVVEAGRERPVGEVAGGSDDEHVLVGRSLSVHGSWLTVDRWKGTEVTTVPG